MSLINRLLDESLRDGSWIELYTDQRESNRFNVGVVLALSEEGYVLQTLDRDGSWDPVHVSRLDEVFKVTRNTPYLRMLAATERGRAPETPSLAPDVKKCLRWLVDEHHVVTIADEDGEQVHATILDVDDEEYLFSEISREGETVGEEARRIDLVRRLELFGPTERSIERLLWSEGLRTL